MTQKRMKSVRGTLSNLEAPKMKKKRSDEKSIVEIDSVAHSQAAILSQQDLLREILSWLPVPSLLRFKCVEKSWDVTSDPYFWMKNRSHRQDEVRFLVVHCNFSSTPPLHNLYSTSSLSSPHDVQNIDYLYSNDNPYFHILCGSCNGLVLMRVAPRFTHEFLLLWNPSTRESIRLPYPISGIRNSTFGLGYDPTGHDYKILTIYVHKSQTQCGILALKSGSWRNVDIESPRVFRYSRSSIGLDDPLAFVHGAFHWIPCSFWIVSFNISNEVYTRIPLLEQMYSYLSVFIPGDYIVSVLDGMLCFSSSYLLDGPNTFTLWAMKDYGVKETWTQLFKIKLPRHCIAKPIYRFPDGDVLFHCRGGINGVNDLFRASKGRFKLWSDSLVQRRTRVVIITFNESLINPKLLI